MIILCSYYCIFHFKVRSILSSLKEQTSVTLDCCFVVSTLNLKLVYFTRLRYIIVHGLSQYSRAVRSYEENNVHALTWAYLKYNLFVVVFLVPKGYLNWIVSAFS